MTYPVGDRHERVAAAILDYLVRHPNAQDTARGIRECWLPRPLQEVSQEDVERVLERLVLEGRVGAVTVPRNATLFTGRPVPSADPKTPLH